MPGRRRSSSSLLLRVTLVLAIAGMGAAAGCRGPADEREPVSPSVSAPTTPPASPDTTSQPPETGTPGAPSTPPETVTPPRPTRTVLVYLASRDEKIVPLRRTVPYSAAVANSAMRALLDGPTSQEAADGLSTTIPDATRLNSVKISNGTAIVDLSQGFGSGGGSLSMTMRVAQVVHTLTQFPTVKRVSFRLDGKPVTALGGEGVILDRPQTRADWEQFAPAVLIEQPVRADVIASPLTVRGTANVFEAVFMLEITDGDGRIVATQRVQATSGTGTRGTFSATVRFTDARPGVGEVIASYRSAKDGKRVVVAEVPVRLR